MEFHVSLNGNDTNRGTTKAPLRTIQRAADLAQAGDTITVHGGVYRERVNPPRGGTSVRKRITYQAAAGEPVAIKGSEVIKSWTKVEGDVWKAVLPNSFFGAFNPYLDLIRGDWFDRRKRNHHPGAVYLDGHWLTEAATLEEALRPTGTNALWFAQVDETNTTIWAQFSGANPNERLVEVNVRRSVFYPDRPGRGYIAVRGFTLEHAATPWAPPTAEQVALLGTHWSKGWLIESNTVRYSTCSGISLGKHGDAFDNTSADTAEGYVKTIERAHAHAITWTRDNIGHHIVRNNHVSDCEQAGIVGSLGAAFSSVTGNVIHDIHVRRLFGGAEMAGIKFHAAIDTEIRGNHIYRTCRGLWLDWMAQGTRVSGNLFHDNMWEDLFVEVDHGPFVIDNNLFLSPTALLDMSQGGAYAHNLFVGRINSTIEPTRETPFHDAHSTKVAGLKSIVGGDNRFYNNLFVGSGGSPGEAAKNDTRHRRVSGYGLWVYDTRELPVHTGGNVLLNCAQAHAFETNCVLAQAHNPQIKLARYGDHLVLEMVLPEALKSARTQRVTTKLLGANAIARLPYEDFNGGSLNLDRDFIGVKRGTQPTAGPFEGVSAGSIALKLR